MQLWEGAILVVGGVFLVSYMAKKNAATMAAGKPSVAGTAAAGVSAVPSMGMSNLSNLTTITNQAGGNPTRVGEQLVPMNPPINVPFSGPYSVSPYPIAQPIVAPVIAHPVLTNVMAVPALRSPAHQILL